MKALIKLIGSQKQFSKTIGMSLRSVANYVSGESPMESMKLGNIVKMAKELEMTEQEVINILLKRIDYKKK